MLDALYQAVLSTGDVLLGWLLALPREAAIVAVAAGTATVLTLVRLVATDQDLLRRCREDRRTLKLRLRAARAATGALAAVRQRVALKALRQEALPLLVSILPIALLATWCFARLAYVPPQAGEQIAVVAYYPISAAGQLAHLVPQEGLGADGGWIREIVAATGGAGPYARAEWTVRAEARPQPYDLVVRSDSEEYTHQLLVGQRTYYPPVRWQKGGSRVNALEVKLRPARPFGILPGVPVLALQPWLVGYLLVTICLVAVLRRVLRIY